MEEKRKKGEGAIGRNELREKGKGLRIDFWNVVGVKGKNEQFWERIREWDVGVSGDIDGGRGVGCSVE